MDHKAKEVLGFLKDKRISVFQEAAEKGTKLYTAEEGRKLLEQRDSYFFSEHMTIKVTDETTQEVAHRLVKEDVKDLVLLNFASGRHVGGGFLRGSKAQEEDLCRCSGLYNCLLTQPEYYRVNQEGDRYFSDYVIYSPNVPWFRKNSNEMPGEIFLASVITSPAPNTSKLKNKEGIEEVLRRRAGIILAIARDNKHRNLLLGAWGCGVYGNSPALVASIFKEWLHDQRFSSFDTVTFAVYCPGSDKSTFNTFKEILY